MKKSVLLIGAFTLFFIFWYNNIPIRWIKTGLLDTKSIRYTLSFLLSGIIPLIALLLIHKKTEIPESLGLSRGVGTGWLMAVCATLPMSAGFAIIGEPNTDITADSFAYSIFVAGFFEELYFRGFAFGQLFRYARWGFIPAVIITALPFGALHMYQGHDPISSFAAMGVTAAGGVFFCWLYVEWNYNLWCSIGMHTLMNMSWVLFNVSDNGATGGLWTNIFRILTIATATLLTVRYKKKYHIPYQVTRATLWVN